MTGGAAAALVVLAAPALVPGLVLPRAARRSTDSRSALQVFTWVEAAILLVALAVLFLVYARAQRQAFHLPGGDGFVVSAAGGWALALIVWRLFDKPDVDERAATVGIQWGIFFALLAAAALVAAGARVRAAGRPGAAQPDRRGGARVGGAAPRAPERAAERRARASTPRSRRSCASARRAGTASRRRRRGAPGGRGEEPPEPPPPPRPPVLSNFGGARAVLGSDAARRRRGRCRGLGPRHRPLVLAAPWSAPRDVSRPHTFIDDVSIAFVPTAPG